MKPDLFEIRVDPWMAAERIGSGRRRDGGRIRNDFGDVDRMVAREDGVTTASVFDRFGRDTISFAG